MSVSRSSESGVARMNGRETTIVVVGGGASGVLCALRLSRAVSSERIVVCEPGTVGAGAAYGTRCPDHLLNVPAGRMSALAEDPDHFLRWLRRERPQASGADFAQRRDYGAYLSSLLAECPGVERVAARVDDLEPLPDGFLVRPIGLRAASVVLALGNASPDDPCAVQEVGDTRYARDPWAPRTRELLAGAGSVLLIGTGLTMVDMVLELESLGHQGRIRAVSRRGLLPTVHRPPHGPPRPKPTDPDAWPRDALGLLRAIRLAARTEPDWREAINDLRPITPALWMRMPLAERRRFLARLRPFWDVHRHRMAPEVAGRIGRARSEGRLVVERASVERIVADAEGATVDLRTPYGRRSERVDLVVNCSGPCVDPLRGHALLARLAERGIVRADPLRLGLDATPEGAVIDAQGAISQRMHAIGPLLRGVLWECTAIPEIRVQAERVANAALRAVASASAT
jgi:uncharacterized NAD(P)/FAD-binding protein YdhS